jgi:transglutaminase-like putative cysteine protease
MRFANAHKAATYLMVGFAYLAMVSGGGVSGGIALGGLVGLVGSWWWEPPLIRFEKWSWVWTIASIFALGYAVLMAVATADYLGVGAEFLMWLLVAKAFNRRAARDWQQMYLLAFLMLVAGSVLNADLTYGLCFLGFVIASTWALTLFHLRREMEDNLLVKHAADRASERVEVRRILDSKRIVGPRFFAGTGALSMLVFLGSAVVFLALPRVGMGFFLKSKSGTSFAGFSDSGTQLGGHGVIKNDETVVMRVEIDPKFGAPDAPEIHWRGVAFDHYSLGRWTRSNTAPQTRETTDRGARPNRERHAIIPTEGFAPDTAAIDAYEARSIRQDIWLEPIDSDVLFGASMPFEFEYTSSLIPRTPRTFQNDELHLERSGTIHYSVWSTLSGPEPDRLRAAPKRLPNQYFGVYLQLPPEITARTRALAKQITAGLTNNYDRAVAIQQWLTTNLTYTLELEEPTSEPVDYFLFERKKGHCEYFASAFAVLARAVGIPTRQVNGFLGGEWNEYQGYEAVRAGDAHSWDEVYFAGQGWVTFDATPASDQLGRGGTGWRARLSRYLDTLRFQWTKWVIEYDLASQLGLFRDLGNALKGGATAVKEALGTAWHAAKEHAGASGTVVGVIAAGIAYVLARRRRRDAMTSPGRAAARRKRTAIALSFDRAAKALAKAGVIREPAATPRELAARTKVAAKELGELVDLYYAAEWGGRADAAAERRAEELATSITTAAIESRRRRAA